MIKLTTSLLYYAYACSTYRAPSNTHKAPAGLIWFAIVLATIVSVTRWTGFADKSILMSLTNWPIMCMIVVAIGHRNLLFGMSLISIVVDLAAIAFYPDSNPYTLVWEMTAYLMLAYRVSNAEEKKSGA